MNRKRSEKYLLRALDAESALKEARDVVAHLVGHITDPNAIPQRTREKIENILKEREK
jgi:hypothetical protein